MRPDLPDVLDRYFEAQNDHGIDAMVACFAADAAVRDEGRAIAGADAIRAWPRRGLPPHGHGICPRRRNRPDGLTRQRQIQVRNRLMHNDKRTEGGPMSPLVPDVITRYFESDARRDIEAIVALFTEDAAVVDEGQTYHGKAEIRDWQEGAASKYQYTTEVFGTERTGEESYLATGRLTGNFPGGTADLRFRFTVAGDLISRLEIAP